MNEICLCLARLRTRGIQFFTDPESVEGAAEAQLLYTLVYVSIKLDAPAHEALGSEVLVFSKQTFRSKDFQTHFATVRFFSVYIRPKNWLFPETRPTLVFIRRP